MLTILNPNVDDVLPEMLLAIPMAVAIGVVGGYLGGSNLIGVSLAMLTLVIVLLEAKARGEDAVTAQAAQAFAVVAIFGLLWVIGVIALASLQDLLF